MALGLTRFEAVEVESAEAVATATLEWASDTGGAVLDAADTEWYQMVNLQVSVDFHADATLDAEVHVRKSVDGGTVEDTPEIGTFLGIIPNPADGSVVIKTFSVYDFSYLDVGLKNLDAAEIVEAWACKYDGYKVTGMAAA